MLQPLFKAMCFLFISIASSLQLIYPAAAADSTQQNSSLATTSSPLAAEPSSKNSTSLHRLDFRIEGSSCPACLHKIQDRLEAVPGVLKALVMLKHPFAAVAVYDAKKTSTENILATVNNPERNIQAVDTKDAIMEKMPIVLAPLYMDMNQDAAAIH